MEIFKKKRKKKGIYFSLILLAWVIGSPAFAENPPPIRGANDYQRHPPVKVVLVINANPCGTATLVPDTGQTYPTCTPTPTLSLTPTPTLAAGTATPSSHTPTYTPTVTPTPQFSYYIGDVTSSTPVTMFAAEAGIYLDLNGVITNSAASAGRVIVRCGSVTVFNNTLGGSNSGAVINYTFSAPFPNLPWSVINVDAVNAIQPSFKAYRRR